MEKSQVNPVDKVELPKAEQSVKHFSVSKYEKNIQEVFKLSPELKTVACDSLGIKDDKDIVVELGRNKDEATLSKIQNINVYYKGELILNSDDKSQSKKLILVTQKDGTSFVGDILLPEELQGKGLGAKILQKVSDTLNTKILPTYLSTGGFTSDNAKKMWEKIGNEILPNHEAEKLYAEYLETIFPESKVRGIVYHRTGERFDVFDKSKTKKTNANRFYFSPINTGRYGDHVMQAILNIKNLATPYDNNFINDVNIKHPEYTKGKSEYFHLPAQIYVNADKYGYDGVYAFEGTNDDEYSVYHPEQIHILGSKQDIERFKKFAHKKEK